MNQVDASTFQQELVEKIKDKMRREALSFRNAEDQMCISPSTMSRLLKGKSVTPSTLHKLERWLEGSAAISRKTTKRMRLGGKEFIITIEAE